MGNGTSVDVLNLEFATHHFRARLGPLRWERLAARRQNSRGAERGVDEAATLKFRGPHASLGSRDQAAFGRYACILSGRILTVTRRVAAGYGGDGRCQVCPPLPRHRSTDGGIAHGGAGSGWWE